MPLRTLALLVTLLGTAHADIFFRPTPRLFTDVGMRGNFGFKLLPEGGSSGCIGELFKMMNTGATPVVWRAKLRACPLKAYVDSTGAVVTLDNYGPELRIPNYLRAQARHALVIYDPRGKVVADLAFSDVMPSRQDDFSFGRGTPGVYLSAAFKVGFGSAHFSLRGQRGNRDGPSYDLITGKRLP